MLFIQIIAVVTSKCKFWLDRIFILHCIEYEDRCNLLIIIYATHLITIYEQIINRKWWETLKQKERYLSLMAKEMLERRRGAAGGGGWGAPRSSNLSTKAPKYSTVLIGALRRRRLLVSAMMIAPAIVIPTTNHTFTFNGSNLANGISIWSEKEKLFKEQGRY